MKSRHLVVLVALLEPLFGCNFKRLVMTKAVEAQVSFFQHESSESGLEQLSPRVYTFSHESDRGIVIVTDVGLVVSDTFNQRYVAALKTALAGANLETRVHTVIYSHHHLDHVGGASALAPEHVVAHRDAPRYWASATPDGIVPPSQLIEGPQVLEIGNVRIELIDTSPAHAATLYAIHIPAEKVLYAPDTLAPNAFLFGFTPDVPIDGYFDVVAALDRLPFDTFVASHLGYGSRNDFDATVKMLGDVRTTAHGLFAEAGLRRSYLHYDKKVAATVFQSFYDQLHERYGDWHGFDENILPAFIRLYTSELLGDVTRSASTAAAEPVGGEAR